MPEQTATGPPIDIIRDKNEDDVKLWVWTYAGKVIRYLTGSITVILFKNRGVPCG